MVKIYLIEDCNGLKYVGSTILKLKYRLSKHRSNKKCSSRELNLDDCKIYTLEECDEENRKIREQYWIDHTECVNERNTIFDKKEYDKQRQKSDKSKEYKKNYHQENREKKLEYQLNNYHYKNSWGGDPRSNNNLLKIDLNIFL